MSILKGPDSNLVVWMTINFSFRIIERVKYDSVWMYTNMGLAFVLPAACARRPTPSPLAGGAPVSNRPVRSKLAEKLRLQGRRGGGAARRKRRRGALARMKRRGCDREEKEERTATVRKKRGLRKGGDEEGEAGHEEGGGRSHWGEEEGVVLARKMRGESRS